MNIQTRLLNLLNFQGNSSGKTEDFISSAEAARRRAVSRTGSRVQQLWIAFVFG
jgi:hypothetical protein